MIRRPPRSTLFPDTPLSRSGPAGAAVGTADVALSLGRKPASLSPARDSLIKKGLVYSAERGQIAFTVPHFGRYLLSHRSEEHTSELQSRQYLVCRLLLDKKT